MLTLRLVYSYPSQEDELKEHLYYNGYTVVWKSKNILFVDAEEIDYIKTILQDRHLTYTVE